MSARQALVRWVAELRSTWLSATEIDRLAALIDDVERAAGTVWMLDETNLYGAPFRPIAGPFFSERDARNQLDASEDVVVVRCTRDGREVIA